MTDAPLVTPVPAQKRKRRLSLLRPTLLFIVFIVAVVVEEIIRDPRNASDAQAQVASWIVAFSLWSLLAVGLIAYRRRHRRS